MSESDIPNSHTERKACPHCNGSGGVKTGPDEYSTCPCQSSPVSVDINHLLESILKLLNEIDSGNANYIENGMMFQDVSATIKQVEVALSKASPPKQPGE
jgi:hypothetical protein